MARALILGCGAIGRGFLPWLLDEFEIDFYDSNDGVVRGITEQSGYCSFMTQKSFLKKKLVKPRRIFSSLRNKQKLSYDIAFSAVGPRNILFLPDELCSLDCPIFSLENDPASVNIIKDKYNLENVFFGVPDVITSNTASPLNLEFDPYSIHTEDGTLYLEESRMLGADLRKKLPSVAWLPLDQLKQEWDAKLYLHNTPHCIAAFLGHLLGHKYLHEALANESISHVIGGVVDELLQSLKFHTKYDHSFMEAYAAKEVKRFSNQLLFDPITRVAREPIRKLQPEGRLIGALRLMLSSGISPTFLMIGIAASLSYIEKNDNDYQQISELNNFGLPMFLYYHLGLEPNSLESTYIAAKLPEAAAYIKREIL